MNAAEMAVITICGIIGILMLLDAVGVYCIRRKRKGGD